jgi:hypothetical protein
MHDRSASNLSKMATCHTWLPISGRLYDLLRQTLLYLQIFQFVANKHSHSPNYFLKMSNLRNFVLLIASPFIFVSGLLQQGESGRSEGISETDYGTTLHSTGQQYRQQFRHVLM